MSSPGERVVNYVLPGERVSGVNYKYRDQITPTFMTIYAQICLNFEGSLSRNASVSRYQQTFQSLVVTSDSFTASVMTKYAVFHTKFLTKLLDILFTKILH